MAIETYSRPEYEGTLVNLQRQGWAVATYTPVVAHLRRNRDLSVAAIVLLLLFGWLLCWIPLIVYLVVFALTQTSTITVRLWGPDAVPVGTLSEDGCWWWDGQGWQAIAHAYLPAQVPA